MKHRWFVALIALGSVALAMDVGFAPALRSAADRPPVEDARLVLADAVRSAERTDADPLALRLERVQARHAVELAERSLAQSLFQAERDIAGAYTRTLQADAQLALAMQARDLAARSLDIARIRFERGSATGLDVRDAETELARADNDARAAREGRALAISQLASLVGIEDATPQPIAFDPLTLPVPNDEAYDAQLEGHPSLLQARQGLEIARVARDLLDPSYAPQAQIDQADVRVDRAAEGVQEARRGLSLQSEQLIDAVVTARERVLVERDALAAARDRFDTEQQRYAAGLIAEVQLDRARLTVAQAGLSAMQAEHALWMALFDLQAGTVTPVEGLDAF